MTEIIQFDASVRGARMSNKLKSVHTTAFDLCHFFTAVLIIMDPPFRRFLVAGCKHDMRT